MNAILNAPPTSQTPVSRRYSAQERVSANTLRLRAVVKLFRLSPSDVAKATGFSRPYVARLLSAKDDFQGSAEFYRKLECKLGTIIDGRQSQYFTCPAVSLGRVRGVLEQMAVEPAVEVDLGRAV